MFWSSEQVYLYMTYFVAFVVEIVGYFYAGVCGFDFYFVVLNRFYTFLKLQWGITYINYREIKYCLKIRTSLTWERHKDNFSYALNTTENLTKIAQYFSISTTASKQVLKRYKISKLYSLESMVIEEKNPVLNTQITLNGKQTILSIYWFNCFWL